MTLRILPALSLAALIAGCSGAATIASIRELLGAYDAHFE